MKDRPPLPPLDGVACAARMAEMLAQAALPRPRGGSFATPSKHVTKGLGARLAALLGG